MNINDVSTQLIYTTVPIYAIRNDNKISSGTGFLFSFRKTENTSIPMLITNYHVLENCINGFIELHIGENGLPTNKSIRIPFDKTVIINNKLGDLDLITIPLGPTIKQLQSQNIEIFFRCVDQNMIPTKKQVDEFSAIENITFIGYPSGLYDEKNKISIIRQGITATPIWNEFKGEKVFLIDAGVFPGSSGSPVFIYNQGSFPTKDGIEIGNRLYFVGIISQTLLTDNTTGKDYLNLGKVINSISMYGELEQFLKKIKQIF